MQTYGLETPHLLVHLLIYCMPMDEHQKLIAHGIVFLTYVLLRVFFK